MTSVELDVDAVRARFPALARGLAFFDGPGGTQVPQAVIDAMRGELRGVTSEVQFHLTGILYYRYKFFRESPRTILIPGEWQDAVPGRYVRASEALERWEMERGG